MIPHSTHAYDLQSAREDLVVIGIMLLQPGPKRLIRHEDRMQRREFISLLSGRMVAWPREAAGVW
jgi:hypothetical protein